MRHLYSVSWFTVALLVSGLPAAGSEHHEDKVTGTLSLTSAAFDPGQAIPPRFTADGEDVGPPLTIAGVPKGTVTLALIVDDPDAPVGTWVHWVVWNIPAAVREIATGELPAGAIEGRNSWGHNAYGGPAPPSGTHRYFFRLFALDFTPKVPARGGAATLRAAMEGHVLATAELMGTYSRR